jgi:heme-degrading monooxygenase HmoA
VELIGRCAIDLAAVARATLIELFEDEPPAPGAGATVYRALRDDVPFRFAAVAPGTGAAAYEVAYEDGDPDGAGGVLRIEPFAVPPGDDDRFTAAWHVAREALAGQRGHLGTRLLRAVAPAPFRYVAVARWSSPLAHAKGVAAAGEGGVVPYASHPALYLPVSDA